MTVAESESGLPETQLFPGLLREPTVPPFAEVGATVNESSHVSGSVPARVTDLDVFAVVETVMSWAVGGVFGGDPPVGRNSLCQYCVMPLTDASTTAPLAAVTSCLVEVGLFAEPPPFTQGVNAPL